MATVTIYTKSDCKQCDMSKKLMDREGIDYEERDLDTSEQAVAEVKELNYLAAPVLVVSETEHWSGFQPHKIKALA